MLQWSNLLCIQLLFWTQLEHFWSNPNCKLEQPSIPLIKTWLFDCSLLSKRFHLKPSSIITSYYYCFLTFEIRLQSASKVTLMTQCNFIWRMPAFHFRSKYIQSVAALWLSHYYQSANITNASYPSTANRDLLDCLWNETTDKTILYIYLRWMAVLSSSHFTKCKKIIWSS